MAILTSGTDERSRQLRFFAPPQKLSTAFRRVHAYDVQQPLVAAYADARVHLRRKFADGPDVAALDLPADAGADTLRRRLRAYCRDGEGRTQEQTLPH